MRWAGPWLLTGVILTHQLPVLAGTSALSIIAFATSTVVIAMRWTGLLWVLAGIAWTTWQAEVRLARRLPVAVHGEVFEISGYVDGFVIQGEDSQRFGFRLDHEQCCDRFGPRLIRLSWYGAAPTLTPGAAWRLKVRLRVPRGLRNPGGADSEAQRLRRGIDAIGYVIESPVNQRLMQDSLMQRLLRWRAAIAEFIMAAPGERPSAGLLVALAVGAQQYIGANQWQVHKRTGTGHLLDISGLHVGLVAALGWILGRALSGVLLWLTGRGSPLLGGALLAMSLAGLYTVLAGTTLPTRRAMIMLSVVVGARLLRRRQQTANGLSLALLAVLLHDPFAPMGPGFWLSFGAVAIIATLIRNTPRMPGVLDGGGYRLWRRVALRIWRRASAFVRLQWLLVVCMSPIVAGAFMAVPMFSVPVNLVMIPCFSLLVVPAVLLGVLMMPLSEALASRCLDFAGQCLSILWSGLERIAEHPGAVWLPAPLPWWAWVSVAGGVVLLLMPRGVPGRWLAICFFAIALAPPVTRIDERALRITVLDVGQGLAVVAQTRHHALIYDTGPAYPGGFDAGASIVLPALRRLGVRAPDRLIISHEDLDHAGGLRSIRHRFPDVSTLMGGGAANRAPRTKPCEAGQHWQWDGVRFLIIHPPQGLALEGNNGSCVLRIETDGGAVLLMGDIERPVENWLIEQGKLEPADVVVVPHHGSRTSSSTPVTQRLRPAWAVVAAGYRNRWGFPKPEVVARWRESGATVLNVATEGAIGSHVDPDAGPSIVYRARSDERHYWTWTDR